MTCGIYCITSPLGKIYIGQSTNIEARFRSYKQLSGCKKQRRLYESFKYYGVKSHVFKIIENCVVNKLLERERYWQDFYNATSKMGLNCRLTATTDRAGSHSPESIALMRLKQSGVNNPNYGKRGVETSTYGRKRTESERASIKAYQATRGKIVCQIDMVSGLIIEKAKVRHFVEKGFSQGNISSCCNGRLKSYKGYKFQYEGITQ